VEERNAGDHNLAKIRVFTKRGAVSFAEEVHGDGAGMRRMAMFPKINSLPGAQGELAFHDRNGEVYAGQRGADVGGHVIFAFGSVDEKRVAIGDEPGEEFFEIAADIRVGILLDEEGGRGMAEMKGEEAVLQVVFGEPRGDFVREFIEAATASGDAQFVKGLAEHNKGNGLMG
jgi:hypothetical protein